MDITIRLEDVPTIKLSEVEARSRSVVLGDRAWTKGKPLREQIPCWESYGCGSKIGAQNGPVVNGTKG